MVKKIIITILLLFVIILIVYIFARYTKKRIHNGRKNIRCRVLWKSPKGEYNPSICMVRDRLWLVTTDKRKEKSVLYEFRPVILAQHIRRHDDWMMRLKDVQVFHSEMYGCMLLDTSHIGKNVIMNLEMVDNRTTVSNKTYLDTLGDVHMSLFQHGNELHVLSGITPQFRVQSINPITGKQSVITEYDTHLPYQNINSSSPPVRWNQHLYICATNVMYTIRKYGFSHKLHRTVFVVFQNRYPFSIVAYTDPMHFFTGSRIEFASGLLWWNKHEFLVSLGHNDEHGYLIKVMKRDIKKRLLLYEI